MPKLPLSIGGKGMSTFTVSFLLVLAIVIVPAIFCIFLFRSAKRRAEAYAAELRDAGYSIEVRDRLIFDIAFAISMACLLLALIGSLIITNAHAVFCVVLNNCGRASQVLGSIEKLLALPICFYFLFWAYRQWRISIVAIEKLYLDFQAGQNIDLPRLK